MSAQQWLEDMLAAKAHCEARLTILQAQARAHREATGRGADISWFDFDEAEKLDKQIEALRAELEVYQGEINALIW